MTSKSVFLGASPLAAGGNSVTGSYVQRGDEVFYRIENFNDMDDFFISVVSDSNHWLFISTRGGLSAGRTDCDSALFPYYTEDKLRENSANTGSRTLVMIEAADKALYESKGNGRNRATLGSPPV